VSHPAIAPNHVAVVTGGASGIGLAAAMRFAGLGMKVCIADLGGDRLNTAEAKLSSAARGASADVMAMAVDVSRIEQVSELENEVRRRFGCADVVMNNAGIQPGSTLFGPLENWQRIVGVNLWGVIHGSQVFAPRMIERGRAGLIINTGSKQGITTPPGDPAYNVTKAGVKAFTEALQHELRNTAGGKISAHLFIPGHFFTSRAARPHRETCRRLDAGADRRLHDRARQCRRFLHPVSRQRRAAQSRRTPHAVGRRRHHRKPPCAVALASGLRRGVCEVCEGGMMLPL
jgi:NAD(P)-dependent dehydrogenase (short-subunit alcohol dehydrogenase family)